MTDEAINDWKSSSSEIILGCCKDTRQYTYRGDRLLNTYMRYGYILTPSYNLYNTLLRGMTYVQPIPKGTLLYRGIKKELTDQILSFLEDENVYDFIDYGFTSFSLNSDVAKSFVDDGGALILLRITDNETPGIFLDSKYGTSSYGEEEVLMGPKLKLKITSVAHTATYSYIIAELNRDYTNNEINFQYKRYNFIPKYIEIIDYINNNPLDIFLIEGKTYFNIPENLILYYLEKEPYSQSAEIAIISNNEVLKENNDAFMKFVLHPKRTCYDLIFPIVNNEIFHETNRLTVYKIKGADGLLKYFRDNNHGNIELHFNDRVLGVSEKVFFEYFIGELVEFAWLDNTNVRHQISYEAIEII